MDRLQDRVDRLERVFQPEIYENPSSDCIGKTLDPPDKREYVLHCPQCGLDGRYGHDGWIASSGTGDHFFHVAAYHLRQYPAHIVKLYLRPVTS